ncbi:putative extracellular elastinolytic metalloproteinase precursor [Moniliophthora roreri]|nr:putative extracellular elastinolytic metalloproteinase precursor [Moniliophthora roreri]
MRFNKSFVLSVLVLCTHPVIAAPSPAWAKYATHRSMIVGNGLELEYYQPRSEFQTYGDGIAMQNPQSFTNPEGLKSNTLKWIQNRLGLAEGSLAWQSGWSTDGVSCGYVNQVHNGIPLVNAVGNIVFRGDNVVSFGHSFIDTTKIKFAPSRPTVKPFDAISTAEVALRGTYAGVEPTLRYLARSDGSAALVHTVHIQNKRAGTSYAAYVDAHNGEILSAVDFVSHARFTALPIQKATLNDGLEIINNPENPVASRKGWTNGVSTT